MSEDEDWTMSLEALKTADWRDLGWQAAMARMTLEGSETRVQYAWRLHYTYAMVVVAAAPPHASEILSKYMGTATKFAEEGYRGPTRTQQERLKKKIEALRARDGDEDSKTQRGMEEIYGIDLPPLKDDQTPQERKIAALIKTGVERKIKDPADVVKLMQEMGVTEKDFFD